VDAIHRLHELVALQNANVLKSNEFHCNYNGKEIMSVYIANCKELSRLT
jgi:hypothetical protein